MLPEVSIMSFETGWNTLEELRDVALAAGFTPAQFKEVVDTVGDDPYVIATHLQRYAVRWQTHLHGQERRAI
jgi:hypothetical protein